MQMSVSFAASCRDPFVASLGCFCISNCPIFFDVEDSPEFEILPFRFRRSDSFCNSSHGCLVFFLSKKLHGNAQYMKGLQRSVL